MENFVLIDSNAIIHRSYHALPKTMSSRGVLTNAVYGYTTTLIKVLEELKPKYIAATFDLAGPTFRHEAFAEYKATRVKADQELYDQIPLVRELLESLNIKVFEKSGFEADDCIGTITSKIQKSKIKNQNNKINTYIVTGDKDLFQLLNSEVSIYWLKRGLSESAIVNKKIIREEFNLDPEDFIDLKALAGDPSDNIPGVPGIGPKTATELIIKFDSLKKLYEQIVKLLNCSIDKLTIEQLNNETIESASNQLKIKPRTLRLLLGYKDQAFMSQHLATIERNVPIDFRLHELVWGDYDKNKVREFFEKVGFKSLLKRFGAEEQDIPATKKAIEQQNKDKQLKLL